MNRTKELLIIDAWKPLEKEVVGASELEFIRETIVKRFGADASPASIARALADHGVRLGHPEILQADVRWRDSILFFTPEDLTLDTLEGATALMDKIESLRRQLEKPRVEELYRQVRQLKSELELTVQFLDSRHCTVKCGSSRASWSWYQPGSARNSRSG